jgi:hypothetical protein
MGNKTTIFPFYLGASYQFIAQSGLLWMSKTYTTWASTDIGLVKTKEIGPTATNLGKPAIWEPLKGRESSIISRLPLPLTSTSTIKKNQIVFYGGKQRAELEYAPLVEISWVCHIFMEWTEYILVESQKASLYLTKNKKI